MEPEPKKLDDIILENFFNFFENNKFQYGEETTLSHLDFSITILLL